MHEEELIELRKSETEALYKHPLARAYLNKVYGWMSLTMLVTTVVAVYSTHNDTLNLFTSSHPLLILFAGLGIVVAMSLGRHRLGVGTLTVLLVLFSALEGLLFGPVLQFYTQESLALTFACTAGTFGVTAIYGACTKRNLSVMGRTLFMILLGLIICMILNAFWGNGTFDMILSAVGVVLFSLLTAYDTQMLLQEGLALHEEESRAKGAILGALSLYLDFINLFLYLLRFLGDRR